MATGKKRKLAVDPRTGKIAELAKGIDHKTLATWGLDCAERVLPYFERSYPNDDRPETAIETGRTWVETGVFSMAVIRKASLDSHAAARAAHDDGNDAARSAARAAGHAVATAHVPTHALGAAAYAATAIRDATGSDDAMQTEREWQYRHLLELGNGGTL